MDPQYPVDMVEFRGGARRPATVEAIREVPLSIFASGLEVVRLLCSGMHPRFLAAGYLFSCGMIQGPEDIADINVLDTGQSIDVRVELRAEPARVVGLDVTSGLGRMARTGSSGPGTLPAPGSPWVSPESIVALTAELHARSELYRRTRGCHNSSLCTGSDMLFFRSDIGRHNAIDTLVGQCLLEAIPTGDKMIVTTGRIASEIVHKAAMAGIGAMASTAVATALAVEKARECGLTLIGNSTGEGFWLYNDRGRIKAG